MANKEKILYDDGLHKCIMFSFDDEAEGDSYLSVNQYLIVQNGSGVLLDPGSQNIFDDLSEAVSRHIELENIKYIFISHQDPDVAASISEWYICTPAKFIMSHLWVRFMSHYGFMDMARVMPLADHGAKLNFGKDYLKFLPAHFLHSPGNFSLYDSRSKILFSGDIGAAVTDSETEYKIVKSFEDHLTFLEGFHKRYMGSNKLCRAWVESVEKLQVNKIAPQHGLVFEAKSVELFLEWFKELKCGSDNLHDLY